MFTRLMAKQANELKYVVMAGIYTIKAFTSREEAEAFAERWPDPCRVVERHPQHRHEWPVERGAA
jgi:hypothetical protein